ncbi:MAG TPA: zinc ribbon domain-containing protein [Tepidiformaceae bacterium]|nr:zinc ribbon domain-containing protein [Tepidiformaceae bacterium]
MPQYEYRCRHCSGRATIRRAIDEMDDPAECLSCGGTLERQFAPTSNIHIPSHFHYTWSDFHDVTEKELAKDPYVERSSRVFSSPGHGRG